MMAVVRFYADLHIHSKFSRACSRDCDLEHLAWWAGRKGIGVVGTGDFTHPAWREELGAKLVPDAPGLFRLRPELERAVLETLPPACRTPVRFLLSSEISTIYKRDDRTRKVHHLLYAPSLDAVDEITRQLLRIGNLASDGRPILGLDSRNLLEITLSGGDGCYLVPAHAWTPWFAVLGSQSGFDRVADCYADLASTSSRSRPGLSSDPEMNWRVSSLDQYRLVSNSDAHSPPMLGREATAFTCEADYFSIERALRTGDGFDGTVEFFPEEGKYHLDGHRACDVRTTPAQTRAAGGKCPVCGKKPTIGVQHRVDLLADRPEGYRRARGGRVHLVRAAAGDPGRDRRRRPEVQVGHRSGHRAGGAVRAGAVDPRRRAARRPGGGRAVDRGGGDRPAPPRRRPPRGGVRRRLRDDPAVRPGGAGRGGAVRPAPSVP